jgi:hypothetical protein
MARRKRLLWNGKEHNLAAAAKRLGLCKTYFYSLARYNDKTFMHMQRLGETPEEGYTKYRIEYDGVRQAMADIYFELIDQREISSFGRFLYERGVYRSPLGFRGLWGSFFLAKTLVGAHKLEKYKRIVALYDEFKKG